MREDVQFTIDLFTMEDKLLAHILFDNWQLHIESFKAAINYLTKLIEKLN